MSKMKLSDSCEKAIVESFEHHMEEISNAFGGKEYFLHKALVEAFEKAVERGVYRAMMDKKEDV